jgi:hypothetical protein
MSPDEYSREVESYLCRKNDGHLIRIVGPAFELVSGWAAQGIPLKVVFSGIDRYFVRYYAKGPRRRPVRIDFCDADVLDAFDEWRRAVGVRVKLGPADDVGPKKPPSLVQHLNRVIARLTASRAGGTDPVLDEAIARTVRELDAARAGVRTLRGRARAEFHAHLAALDRQLLTIAHATVDRDARAELASDAEAELAPFRGRLTDEAYEQALASAIDRLLRERLELPALTP